MRRIDSGTGRIRVSRTASAINPWPQTITTMLHAFPQTMTLNLIPDNVLRLVLYNDLQHFPYNYVQYFFRQRHSTITQISPSLFLDNDPQPLAYNYLQAFSWQLPSTIFQITTFNLFQIWPSDIFQTMSFNPFPDNDLQLFRQRPSTFPYNNLQAFSWQLATTIFQITTFNLFQTWPSDIFQITTFNSLQTTSFDSL